MPWMENLSMSTGLTPTTPSSCGQPLRARRWAHECAGLTRSSLTRDTPWWCRCVSSGSSDLQLSSTASFQGASRLDPSGNQAQFWAIPAPPPWLPNPSGCPWGFLVSEMSIF